MPNWVYNTVVAPVRFLDALLQADGVLDLRPVKELYDFKFGHLIRNRTAPNHIVDLADDLDVWLRYADDEVFQAERPCPCRLYFPSCWSSPIPFYEAVCHLFPEMPFAAFYTEEIPDFLGIVTQTPSGLVSSFVWARYFPTELKEALNDDCGEFAGMTGEEVGYAVMNRIFQRHHGMLPPELRHWNSIEELLDRVESRAERWVPSGSDLELLDRLSNSVLLTKRKEESE